MHKNEAAELLLRMSKQDIYGPTMRLAFGMGAASLADGRPIIATTLEMRQGLADIETLADVGLRILPADDVATESGQMAQFVAVANRVHKGRDCIAKAKSSTFAKRIANALNQYRPNRRGQ